MARSPSKPNDFADAVTLDSLAEDYWRFRDQIREASKNLHDHAGSQLAAAGLHLQMLYTDFPQMQDMLQEIFDVLAGAMESVRNVSKDLSTSPVRALGFKGALGELTDRHGISLIYKTNSRVAHDEGDHLYHIVDLILEAIPGVSRSSLTVTGVYKLVLKIRIPGGERLELEKDRRMRKAQILAKNCACTFRIDADQVTMVTIEYAIRRPSR